LANSRVFVFRGAEQVGLFQELHGDAPRHPHGVGKYGARDHTKSSDPVTNFRRSNRLYLPNRGLDRDKDGISCEKH
jgi:hypothetical protein